MEDKKEFYSDLAKAQAEIESASFNKKNPHFNSKYANLEAYISEIKPVLGKHGLALVQGVVVSPWGGYALETTLLHRSGNELKTLCPILTTKPDMQGFGSGETYARRYSIAALFNMSADDDDGNLAVQKKPDAQFTPNKTAVNPAPVIKDETPISITDLGNLYELAISKKINKEATDKRILDLFKCEAKDLKKWQYNEIIVKLK